MRRSFFDRQTSGLESGPSRAHIHGMPETLTKEEFKALKQIGDARAEGTIPTKTRNRLIEIGYAKEVLGGLVITEEGMLRIVMGK
jgi:hypothetical protein